MKVSDLIIGLFLFSGIMLGMGTFFTTTAANYNTTAPALEGYGNTSKLNDMMNNMAAPLQSGQLSFEDTPFLVLSTGWTALTIPFQTTAIAGEQINKAANEIPDFPDWVAPLLQGLVLLVIVFSVIVAVTKVNI